MIPAKEELTQLEEELKIRLYSFRPEIGNKKHIEAGKELVKLQRIKTVADRIRLIKQILKNTE